MEYDELILNTHYTSRSLRAITGIEFIPHLFNLINNGQ